MVGLSAGSITLRLTSVCGRIVTAAPTLVRAGGLACSSAAWCCGGGGATARYGGGGPKMLGAKVGGLGTRPKPRPKHLTGGGGDALSDRCGGGGSPTNLGGGGGSITSAGCVGGGGEIEVVGVGIGRGQVVRAGSGGGGGDMTAARCRCMGCNRLTGVVVFLVTSVAAAAAAATTGVVVVAAVVGAVTIALRPVSPMSVKDTAVVLRGRGAGGVFFALTAVDDVKIPGGLTRSDHAPGTTSHHCR